MPVAQVNLVVLRGSADDPAGKFGIASLTAAMLQEGAGSRSSLEIADAIDFLGADLTTTAGIDSSAVRLHVPVARLADALPIMADVALRPTFPKEELDRLRQERLTAHSAGPRRPGDHRRDGVHPRAVRRRRIATARPSTAPPTTLKAFTRRRSARVLRRGVSTRRTPSLLVVGDVTHGQGAAAARVELRRLEGARRAAGAGDACPPCRTSPTRTVYLVDKPGAPQSQIRIGWVGVPRSTPDYFPIQVMNTILGGSFASRLNMNLREKNGYTYGASSGFDMRASAGPFVAAAGVQTDKTSEALKEFFNELNGILQPVPADELTRAKNYVSLRFPAGFETTVDISRRLEDAIVYHLPDDYFAKYVPNIEAVTAADVQRVAQKYIQPESQCRRDHGGPEGHRAGNSGAEARADQDSDDRRRVRSGAGTLAARSKDRALHPTWTLTPTCRGRLLSRPGPSCPVLPSRPSSRSRPIRRARAAGAADPPLPVVAPRASPAPCLPRRTPGTSAGT